MQIRDILVVAVVTVAGLVTICHAQSKSHDERCQVAEGNGIRVDECDSRKFLTCRDGRCQCPDPANQVFYYRLEPVASRVRRSPGKKGSGFKKVAVGAVAGVATYQAAKAVGKGINNGFTTTAPPPKYERVYSCYGRVGAQCVWNYNNWETIEGTSTSTAAPEITSSTTTTAASDNATTTSSTTEASSTTAAPSAAAQTQRLDISKIPKCVPNAFCKSGAPTTPSNGTTTSASFGYKVHVDNDPRLGVCECSPGYTRNSKDLCERVKNGAGLTSGTVTILLASIIINKLFA